MSINDQQLAQAIRNIEEQLAVLKQALGEENVAQEGVVGIFDGEFMVEENGKRHQVPPNYASKTMLVPGDTIRMIEDKDGGQTKYKQIGKAERSKAGGILVKKDGKYEVLTDEGSFKVLSASIKHYNGEVGDQVFIQYPKQHAKGSWAAVEKVVSQVSQPATVAMPEIQPVIPEAIKSQASVMPISHTISHQPSLAQETAPAATKAQAASPVELRPASRPKSKSRSSNKSNVSSHAGSKPSSSKPRDEGVKSAQTTTPEPNIAPQAASANNTTDSAFGEDDLI